MDLKDIIIATVGVIAIILGVMLADFLINNTHFFDHLNPIAVLAVSIICFSLALIGIKNRS